MRAISGRKILMTRIFDEKGTVLPVTLVKVKPNIVTQVKTKENDGYSAIQLGEGENKKLNKAEAGHLAKSKSKSKNLFEVKTNKLYKIGDKIYLDEFTTGEIINVSGLSKGKGFAGTVKRHNFNTGPKTHGSHNYRQPGSIGMTGPQKVIKGMRMAGHLGNHKTTVKNLEIIDIDKEKNHILIKGAIPGANNSPVLIWNLKENDNEIAEKGPNES